MRNILPELGWYNTVLGCLAHESDGCAGGNGCNGGCDAVAAGVNVGPYCVGDGDGGHSEEDL